MRDRRFVAQHRGGPLSKERHHQLTRWACDCAEHVLYLAGKDFDPQLTYALEVAQAWQLGKATVGDARKASMEAIAAARESTNETITAVARAVGHAVATAHMADHSLGSAWYGLKAVKSAGGSIGDERKWQDRKLPPGIKELVLTARKNRKV